MYVKAKLVERSLVTEEACCRPRIEDGWVTWDCPPWEI